MVELWWWKKTQYPGYPMNVYNDLSSDKKQKKEK